MTHRPMDSYWSSATKNLTSAMGPTADQVSEDLYDSAGVEETLEVRTFDDGPSLTRGATHYEMLHGNSFAKANFGGIEYDLPFGKFIEGTGKSPCSMGKSSCFIIYKWDMFQFAMLKNQRATIHGGCKSSHRVTCNPWISPGPVTSPNVSASSRML